jgi:hypothetical protein
VPRAGAAEVERAAGRPRDAQGQQQAAPGGQPGGPLHLAPVLPAEGARSTHNTPAIALSMRGRRRRARGVHAGASCRRYRTAECAQRWLVSSVAKSSRVERVLCARCTCKPTCLNRWKTERRNSYRICALMHTVEVLASETQPTAVVITDSGLIPWIHSRLVQRLSSLGPARLFSRPESGIILCIMHCGLGGVHPRNWPRHPYVLLP